MKLSNKGQYIGGAWIKHSGAPLVSINPVTNQPVWKGHCATKEEVQTAVIAARTAFPSWANTPLEKRIAFLRAFKEVLQNRQTDLAEVISQETGKAYWDALSEVSAMMGKIPISIEAYQERTGEHILAQPHSSSLVTRHRPHGVVAVLGPFNFPAHLPNGHIVPALLAGNTAVFKPSELTPLVAQLTLECWEETGLPAGVLNLVQGGRETGEALLSSQINGLFFTGSSSTGKMLMQHFATTPQKILSLEMGGNNPLVVWEIDDEIAAAYLTIQSAYLTAGQRCTCARRLILPKGKIGDAFLKVLLPMIQSVHVASPTERPEPFIGSVISSHAAQKILEKQKEYASMGGESLIEMKLLKKDTGLLTPGLMDVTGISNRLDEEIFGPFLQVIRVDTFEEALREANATAYGLVAGLLSANRTLYEQFLRSVRAGVINWNLPTTGASSRAPFGGIGLSGNHRPAGYYSADYCAYPVASLESPQLKIPTQTPPGSKWTL